MRLSNPTNVTISQKEFILSESAEFWNALELLIR
jgi:hypothetical protein